MGKTRARSEPGRSWKLVAVDHKIKVGMLARLAAKQRVSHRGRAIRALIEVLVRRSK